MPALVPSQRLDLLNWGIIALVAAIMVASPLVSDFRVVWPTFIPPVGVGLALTLGAWFYRFRRPDPKLSAALEGTAQMILFAAVGAPLSYLMAAVNLPLLDVPLDHWDRALGLDWMALLHWMNAHPSIHPAFSLAYQSFTIQATATVLALAFTARLRELKIFVLVFMLSALVCILLSAVMPSEGTWGFYQLTPSDYPSIVPALRGVHLPILHGLRDGSFRDLVGIGAEGIINFPSFHAALGVVFIIALWPVPVVRWVSLVVNLLMIAATPIDGGHYFVDVLVGIAIALACYAAVSFAVARQTAAEPKTVPASLAAAKTQQLAAGE